jgi:hypothetical protein
MRAPLTSETLADATLGRSVVEIKDRTQLGVVLEGEREPGEEVVASPQHAPGVSESRARVIQRSRGS